MSITFNIFDTELVESAHGKYLPIYEGTCSESSPEANFSNTNARNLLLALGQEPSCDGLWTYDQIPEIQHKVHLALVDCDNRKVMVSPEIREGNFFQPSQTDNFAIHRLFKLREILTYARFHKKNVGWG